ncbi:uncharacterized protein Dere_GG12689 [Drosophila erecta]|uniref:Chitin-binding type-2 domain-containing protein n=1 Tax=Drosophila erecta TaxID=7220 RepID=B3P9J9_DROER|nr:uncharacterized protein Dere_GG12689 [Drosophila erecta]
MTHCLWSTLLGLLSVLSMATSRSVRQLPSGYPPVLPTGYYGQPPYAYPPYGYGYQAPPPVYQPYYDNVFGVFKSYPGGGIPVRFDYSNRCSRNYIGIKPHPDQQQYYYVCKPDCVIFSKCRSLESFDASSGRCVQRVSQHRPDHRPPQCQKEGRFPHPHDCQVYYRCDKNRTQPWLFACPSGTIFSPVERKCLPGDQCPSTEISDSGSYIPQNCELKFPECAEEGTFRSPTDCALYYTCRLQESGTYLQTRFKCPGSNSFDLEGKLCRPRSEVDCFDYVPGPVQVPYAPQPYYPPYPAAPPLYEEDDYDTEAKEQQPALKSYPSYKYSTHHRAKEMAAENLEVQQEGVPRNLKLSENVPDLPTMSASAASNREPSKDTTKYQYTDTNPAKNDVTEAPELKSPLKGLHLSQHIVIIESKTTKPPVVSTCPTIPPPSTTLKPSTTSTVTKTTEVISSREPHRTTSAKITTKRHTTVTKKTSTATEKPKTTVVTRTTQKRSTATHNTSPVRTTTIGSTTITPKTSTVAARTEKTTITISTTSKPTTTTQKITTPTPKPTTLKTSTQKPITSTQKESTVTITTKKATESSPLPTLSTEKATTALKPLTTTNTTSEPTTTTQKITTPTPKPTTLKTSTQKPITSTQKESTVTITTRKATESSPLPTLSTEKATTALKPSTTTNTTSEPTTTTQKITTPTPKPTTLKTSTQKPITSTQKESTVTITTKKATESSPLPTLSTEKATTALKPLTTTNTTSEPTTTTQKITTPTPKPTTLKTSTQKPITSTQKESTVTITTKKATESSPLPTLSTEKATTALKPLTTTNTTSEPTTTTQKITTPTPKPTTLKTSTQKPITSTQKESTVTITTKKATESSPLPTLSTEKATTALKPLTTTNTTSEPTTTTQKITTPTPKPTTLKTSTQKPITSTQKESTVTITTKKATESSPLPTLSTEKATTTPKLSTTTTATTTTVAATTRLTTTTISKSSTKTTSSQKPDSTTPKPTTTTNPKTTTVIISTQNPTTSTPKTSTVIITTPKPISSTQKPTSATFQPTSVTATSKSIGTTKVATTTTPQNSTASTAVTTATRSPCADSNSTSDKNTNPACTQELEQVNLLELQSPQKQVTLTDTQPNTSFSGRRNTLDGQEAPDYMDDAPSSAEAQSGQATTARAQTMSTLAAAHILQKLFHIISTTPPSKEHAPTQRPSSQHSSSQSPRGVTIAQMARHNLATSKPFIAHSLRLSIQQLASTQKGSVQPTRKEPEDSEYYDSETSEQYADEENEVLDKTQPRAMSSTTVAALIPAAPSTTTKPESHITTSLPRQTRAASSTTAQPIESPTGELEYGDSSEGSDYVNDANDIPSGVVTSLEARKNFLISLLKQRLTHTELQKPLPAATTSTTPGAPQTSSSSAGPASTTIKSTLALTSSTARPGLTASKHSGPQAPSRQKSLTPLSEEYYDEDDDYMEDEPAGSSEAKKKETGAVLVDDRPPAATAKRHVAQPVEQAMFNRLASRSRESEVEMNAASDELLKRLGRKKTQIPTGSTPNRASAVAKALRRRLAAEVGHPSGLTVPHTSSDPKATQAVMQTTTRTESSSQTTPSTSTETPATQASQKARTRESGEQKPESITQSTLEMVTQTTPESAPPATAVPVAVRQEVLSVNSRPWLLAARNQTVHLTPMSSISISSDARTPSNPVSHANRSFNPLVSRPGDHSTEKVPQLIVKVYEPIDLKIVFCPQSCDQDHDHKYDPADNYKKSNCTGGCDEEEERVHKHVDIQWKPLELTDIAGFRNAV